MKALNKSRGSIVLATILFAVGGVSALNAASYITGANKIETESGRHLGDGETENSNITISNTAGTGSIPFKNAVFGGYSNSKNVLNNKITITGNIDVTKGIEAARLGTTINDVKANNNSVFFDNATYTGSAWAGRAGKEGTTGKNTTTNYNTTVVNKSTVTINSGNLRGAITYGIASFADYNTLHVKGSTIYGQGNNFEITGAFSQTDEGEQQANVQYNQIIFEDSHAYYDSNENSTTRKLFGGAARQGEANNNRAYISDFNKDVDDNIVQTNIYGGATWRPKSGGADGNIAVAVGESKIANIYGGAAGVKADNRVTNISKGANKNLVILDLSGNGKVTENVYGGYIFDTSLGTTTGNAVYFLNGNVAGAVVGGNKEKTENTLILGNDTSTWGTRKAGEITGFDSLNFNVLQEGDKSKAVLSLTGTNSSSLDGVSVKFLSSGNTISDERGNGATDALSGVIYDKYTAQNTTTIKVVNTIDKNGVKKETTNGFEYNTGRDYSWGSGDLDLTKKETKFYLIDSTTSELADYTKMANYNTNIGASGTTVKHDWDNSEGIVIDAYQTNQDYIIDNASAFKRNIRGMFVSTDKKSLYIAGNHDITEEIKDTIGGDDFFTKFGQEKSGNTITISPKGDLDLGTVTFDGGPSGNTLNVGESDKRITMDTITLKDVKDFETINFYLPSNPSPGQTAITLTGGAGTDLSKSNINVFVDNLSNLQNNGGRVHLLKTANGSNIAGNKPLSTNIQIGATVKYDLKDSLDLASAKTVTTNDQTKIFNEARIAGMAAVWEGSYLISNHLERIIPDGYTELFPYAIVEGYDKRYNTGSHVDSLGFNANAGLAGKAPNSKGEFTMGIFIEYGNVDYDAYLDDGTKGSGDAYYAGVGAFGKQENASGSYYEGSFRVGQLTTNFDGTLNFNGVSKYYDWGIDSTYYAVHVGGGKIVPLSESNDLDFYARYFYTHIDAADIKIDGVDTHFDALQSHKIRAGLQDNFKIDEHNKFYLGLAGEYEFSSEAGGRFIVPNGSTGEMLSPDLKGLTGIGEIGYQYKTETLKFDAGVKGYAGKQEGVSAQMALSIAF
ncbi:hypothetical protein OFO03_07420 [Campylobacter sp. JMF_02 ED1]|uniref:hypothetical protein n=2 Tax=Campylobacter TaxID=194 RepID=UPI0022E9B377|nr:MULTISPECIES: hypothetical protein [unclassified Campylobacter]MDA3050125.1 hypothetical protein [Campylobacter sp. JMF_15 NE4]MDA3051729.1 hypothetical protein [Campylobacter sp. JMF_02 ED1]